ncbi:hypothetical protein NKH48_17560 [Mesorhizobium sp. M1233]|uniref:hypothetical protein n=1 Tax=unclassified Mesorhizobium TaxID=325217 RepID=UPI00333576D8
MRIPGGIIRADGQVEQIVVLRPIDGRLEFALCEAVSRASNVEAASDALIETICDMPLPHGARGLNSADRRFLLAQLAAKLGTAMVWQSVKCDTCGDVFEVPIDLSSLPFKQAAGGYPFASATIGGREHRFRIPTELDFDVLPSGDVREAVVALVRGCAVDPLPEWLSDDDLSEIDASLQDASPEIAETAQTACPSCGASAEACIEILARATTAVADPLEEIHRIASAYHWQEAAILDMPRDRRRAYLALIDRDAGMMR